MVFSSLLFLFRFLPIVLVLYFIVPRALKNAVLFLVSIIFYAWGEPIYVALMLFSTLVDYVHGMLVEYFKNSGKIRQAKAVVASSMTINLSLLAFFKYSDFIIQNINSLFHTSIPLLQIALPIGISFYTFQTMSYTVDIYRGQAQAQRNIISFGAYVALFPQLIAGPIVQYKTIAKQLQNRRENLDQFSYGVLRFMNGLGKKVLLANNIGLLWNQISSMPVNSIPVSTAWLGITAYAFQIYFDFSGYSDMAIGLGNMFGFEFLENFDYPYTSKSITEFWRRWHISLGSWFREYVYIPLGGNRCSFAKQIRNIAVVWLLTGIWHGASWNFVMWGVYFGVLLVLEKQLFLKWLKHSPAWFSHVYTVILVWIGWVIFAFDELNTGISYLKVMFFAGDTPFCNREGIYLLLNYGALLIIVIVFSTEYPKRLALYLQNHKLNGISSTVLQGAYVLFILLLSVAYLVDASYNPFLYFRF